jgi:ribonuclease HII
MTIAIRPSRLVANPIGLSHERKLRRCGHGTIAGIDEAGRGPLAGPVVAAAVVLDLGRVPKGLADSKVLTAERREELFEKILATAQVGIASVSHADIDSLNIRQASLSAMCRALAALPCTPDVALVDGNDPPALPCLVETIVKGDAAIASIAAASIVAKVVRDRLMKRLATCFPAYGFGSNVGYSTAAHLSALDREGPCPFHRRSFAPVRDANEA